MFGTLNWGQEIESRMRISVTLQVNKENTVCFKTNVKRMQHLNLLGGK